ncbi:NAD(P)-dependent oxidoreductase [Chloroflexota bacterium]
MKIAILGSTGFLGKVVLKKALDEGYQIRTLVRTPDKLGEFKDRVEFVQGSLSDVDKLEEAVSGAEVVLSTIGPPQKNPGKPEFYERTMKDLVAVLENQDIKRLISTGGAVHLGGENENWTLGRRLLRLFLLLVAKPILVAKQLEWAVLKTSDLDWTLVRPPKIVEGKPTGSVLADEKNLARTQINVDDLASFMLEQITSKKWIRKAPLVASSSKK